MCLFSFTTSRISFCESFSGSFPLSISLPVDFPFLPLSFYRNVCRLLDVVISNFLCCLSKNGPGSTKNVNSRRIFCCSVSDVDSYLQREDCLCSTVPGRANSEAKLVCPSARY